MADFVFYFITVAALDAELWSVSGICSIVLGFFTKQSCLECLFLE